MAVHRLQPSPSGLQCSTARSPVLLHGPRLTGARTGRRGGFGGPRFDVQRATWRWLTSSSTASCSYNYCWPYREMLGLLYQLFKAWTLYNYMFLS
uniref:Uncharacterized protein n=1 Tax=Zea mays TaxID=4577 RepID=C0PIW9_MAIZE|nr:unknown [Zea mays]